MRHKQLAKQIVQGIFYIGLTCVGWAQTVAPTPPTTESPAVGTNAPAAVAPPQSFVVRGTIRSGGTVLPGVSVIATQPSSGRRLLTSTATDGTFQLRLPDRGRWQLQVEFSAFTAQNADVALTPAQPDVAHDFDLTLLSRAPQTVAPATANARPPAAPDARWTHASEGRHAQLLSLNSDLAALAQSSSTTDSEATPADASTLATSADALNDSVSINGRSGTAQDLGPDPDEVQQRIAEYRQRAKNNGFSNDVAGPGGPSGPPPSGRFRPGASTQPHGQVYYQASNAALDAAPYALSGTAAKPSYGTNKFGGMLGSTVRIPHLYDDPDGRTFAFLDYSGTRSNTPYDEFSHVPTLAERAGDFSNTLNTDGSHVQLYDPSTGNLTACSGAIPAGQCVPLNTGATAQQAALALLNYIPSPNVSGAAQQNYHFSSATESDQDQFSLRLIHNLGSATGRAMPPPPPGMPSPSGRPTNNLNLSVNYQRSRVGQLEPFATVGGSTYTQGYALTAGWSVGNRKLSNQLRFGWNRSQSHTSNYYANKLDIAGLAGIVGVSSSPSNYGVPNLSFSGYQSLTDVAPAQKDMQTYSLTDSLTLNRGKHHVRVGGGFRWIDNEIFSSSTPRGSFAFTGTSTANFVSAVRDTDTGNAFADFLFGYAQSASVDYRRQSNEFLGSSWDLFVQDDWRPLSNLSLNFGLRYEYISPMYETHNRLVNLIPSFGSDGSFQNAQVVYPGSGAGRGLLDPQRKNFSPRLGFAWKFDDKTTVRGGYGINYNLSQYASIVQNLAAQQPYAVATTNTAAATARSTITLVSGFPTTSGVVPQIFGIDPHYRVPYVQMWNLNVQRELTPTLLLNLGYTGSKGSALDMLRAPNRNASGILNSGYEAFTWETSQGSSILHAGSLRLRKRMSQGFAVGGTYTWSKSIDNASSVGGTTQTVAQNDRNLRAERSLSSFDQRHKLSGDWTWELPFGEDRRWLNRPGWERTILGDWTLQGSFTFASGTPSTAKVENSATDVAGGVSGALRANATGEAIHLAHPTINEWFNTAAFTQPASGSYGTAGRNTIIGPGSWLMNLYVSKNFPTGATSGMEVRGEADNLLNHANDSGIDTTVNSSTYGHVTSVASMRKMVLSLRYHF